MRNDDIQRLRRDPRNAGFFLDFDGTLSEIVDRPDEARPVEGVGDLLQELARVYRCVAVVSGRSAHQLLEWLGPNIEIWGLHGAERTENGRVLLAPEAERYEAIMKEVAEKARAELADPDIAVENKGVMLGLHYRRAADRDAAHSEVGSVARRLADEYDLKLGSGRMVVELRPPVDFSKAAVIERRSRKLGLQSVCFVGDDIVDLPAFNALDALEKTGVETLRVAVESHEAPGELLERADVTVNGPSGVVELLRSLLG